MSRQALDEYEEAMLVREADIGLDPDLEETTLPDHALNAEAYIGQWVGTMRASCRQARTVV